MIGNGARSERPMNAPRGRARRRGADPAFPRLLGERLCLNFANSMESPIGPDPEEFLRDYPALVRWGRHVGVLTEDQVRRLLAEGERRPDEAAATLARALSLREAIYRLFRSLAHREVPTEQNLATVHKEHVAALAQARLVATGEGFDVVWDDGVPVLDRMLWPVARSAVDLLVGEDPTRVRQCTGPADDCGWLFYDVSKNANRRWCSMEGCGSQAKMRRYRARRRPARS